MGDCVRKISLLTVILQLNFKWFLNPLAVQYAVLHQPRFLLQNNLKHQGLKFNITESLTETPRL